MAAPGAMVVMVVLPVAGAAVADFAAVAVVLAVAVRLGDGDMLKRFIRHFVASYWQVYRCFPPPVLEAIRHAIEKAEVRQGGEIQFVVEAGLSPVQLMTRLTSRERALALFSELRVWDTENNNGVLIYLLLGDRAVEIVADRGVQHRLDLNPTGQHHWTQLLNALQQAFANGHYQSGAVQAVDALAGELLKFFPPDGDANELSDEVRLI